MAASKKPRKTKTKKNVRGGATKAKRARPLSKRAAQTALLVRRAEAAMLRNRKKAEALIKQIRVLLNRIEKDFYKLGQLLTQLSAPGMYNAMGYDSFLKLLKKEKLLGATTAYKMMAVAEAFNAQDAKRVGAARAYALLAYAEATPAADVARELTRANAKIGRRKVIDMSVREIQEAAKEVRRTAGRARDRSLGEKQARAAARKLQASLRREGHGSAKAAAKRADGVWGVTVALSTTDSLALAQ